MEFFWLNHGHVVIMFPLRNLLLVLLMLVVAAGRQQHAVNRSDHVGHMESCVH